VVAADRLTGGAGPISWRRPWQWLPGSFVWGLPLVLVLTVPWFVVAHLQTHGQFTASFFWHHNVERGLGGDEALKAYSWWYYLLVFPLAALP
ncbi:hypothetical protein ABTN40_19675, partial [Acinetobacter baumannii]